MIKKLQRRFALSRKGAVDTVKGSIFCALQNISFMLPVIMLYYLVDELISNSLGRSVLCYRLCNMRRRYSYMHDFTV